MNRAFPLMLELPEATLSACIASTIEEVSRHAKAPQAIPEIKEINMLLTAVNMYLYICSTGADVQPNLKQSQITRRSSTIRDKFREVEVQDVGIRIGAVLRRARTATKQEEQLPPEPAKVEGHTQRAYTPKRPHTRRGHWHHYWTGQRSQPEARKLILKWTHPVLVGGTRDPDKNNTITVFPVKGGFNNEKDHQE